MELKVGDPPVPTYGSYIIHLHSPGGGTATLMNSHWPDEPATFQPIINLDTVDANSGVTIELAGSCQLVGTDPNAKCSMVQISRRGIGA